MCSVKLTDNNCVCGGDLECYDISDNHGSDIYIFECVICRLEHDIDVSIDEVIFRQ